MPASIIMPKLGLTMDEGTIVRWLKREGDMVGDGEVILEVMTDKATVEVESSAAGLLAKILRGEGETVPITTVIGLIALSGEDPGSLALETAKDNRAVISSTPSRGSLPPTTASGPLPEKAGRRPASPAARRLALELGMELETIEGTGPEGRVVEEDVRLAAAKTGTYSAGAPKPLAGLARIVADRMAKSANTAAHYTLFAEADMSAALQRREDTASQGRKASFTAIVIEAVARAMREHPAVNITLTAEGIILHQDINIGVAVDVADGLTVPVIHNADRMDLHALQTELERLTEAGRAGQLRPEDLGGGRFTVSNLGMFGIDAFTMIINQPESAILGVGRILKRPVAVEDRICLRPMMALSLTADHRVINGAPAARFLACMREFLERERC